MPVMPPVFPDEAVIAGSVTANVQFFRVAPDYFRTLEVPLVAGREFTMHDTVTSPAVAVLSESLARRLFAEGQAVGQRLTLTGPGGKDLVIAGVVRDSYIGSLQKHNALQLFTNIYQERSAQWPNVLVRSVGPPSAALASQLRRGVESLGREYPIRIDTMEVTIQRALVQERMLAAVAEGLGVIALLLAAIGLHGLMTYSVARRTAEIGIRMAVGATRSAILRLIAGEAFALVAAGFAVSAPALYGVSKLVAGIDGTTVAIAAAILCAVAVVGVFLPARRAAGLDPMVSLRRM